MEILQLLRFRVREFRSVHDSGWVDADRITALIGANEAGKTNLLLPLWKLNPAKDGDIELLSDLPRKRYSELRDAGEKPVFIEAEFAVPEVLAAELASKHGVDLASIRLANVARDFDGTIFVSFPDDRTPRSLPRSELVGRLAVLRAGIQDLSGLKKGEAVVRERLLAAIDSWGEGDAADAAALSAMATTISAFDEPASGALASRADEIATLLHGLIAEHSRRSPNDDDAVKASIEKALPVFVYYSNYGNLDSEIYLPHVIANLARTDIQGKEAAKVRTLKVLFEFVGLEPKEILTLGEEQAAADLTKEQIDEAGLRKKEREVLLQSASSKLTLSFRGWWKQGLYRFRFQADGRHFRIWVSDDLRPEEVELEGRSTGLQWFLSFYLVFLVESAEAHRGAILLLDEPGHSLHPIAQRDLARFFENLATTNQLVYTTHSPFLVDADHLDRVRSVFVDSQGNTVASPDLRASADPSQAKSIYAVHASLGLTASEGLLLGCKPIVVEGPSDQILLGLMKIALLRELRIAPSRELIFVPSGGVRGVRQVAALLLGRDEELPWVLVDSDQPGRQIASHLRDGKQAWYANNPERVVLVSDLLPTMGDCEVEDLFKPTFLVPIVAKFFRGAGEDFDEFYQPGKPIMTQAEMYARKHALPLGDGWKVEIAKAAKVKALRSGNSVAEMEVTDGAWAKLFEALGVLMVSN